MKRVLKFVLGFLSCTGMITVFCFSTAWAETCEKWVAKAVSVQGTVEARRAGATEWQPVKLNETYCPGDVIRVQKRSRADIALVNQPVLHLDQNTVITLGGVKNERTSVIDLVKGAAHFFSRVARGLEVQTAFVNAGVEGTEFYIRVDEDKTVLSVFEGKVLASNSAGNLAVTGGQSAMAEAGKAPVPRVVVRPRDAVQWALYYPPVVSYRPDEFQGEDWQGMVKKSLESYGKGDLAGAFAGIEGAPEDVHDPRFFNYRASLLLTVGRVEEAGADIERALGLDPQNSNAFALQSIIAVTQNNKEKALSLGQKSVETGPRSAAGHVALSYAQQADFNLNGALASLNTAVQLEPENALVWARLAELRMSFGDQDGALKAAQKAVSLNPGLSRTQTVLGFAYLNQIKVKQAHDAFTKAIELDNADPLPRLGLGLSLIRDGKLTEGGREIEIAASLDPDNALIRSYLGKTYFEEKRDKQSADELNMARQLDPRDPTSFFYDSILKQTTNRPVEALNDIQKAIELNDNRAVYRSRLLLDADLAARSAALARIYGDLGFQQLALAEGWKSENTDPADFSGHRFLADTYAVLPRHEIARVSELLQSQLLQPLNITPIQPHLAESNLFVLSGSGPADLSSNEFNPLFSRDRLALQASGITGGDNTSGEEIVVSGLSKNVSVSAGRFHYETDGFRTNDDVKDDIYNAFVQVSLSPDTSVQAEFRHRETKRGDTALRFFSDDFLPNLRQEDKTDSTRLGFHHAFSPGSHLIGSLMYQNTDRSTQQQTTGPIDPVTFFVQDKNLTGTDKDYSAELQHLYRSDSFKTVIGAGYFNIDSRDHEDDLLSLFLIFDPTTSIAQTPSTIDTPRDVHHANVYVYSYIDVLKNVTLNLGGSADSFKQQFPNGDFKDRSQINPKLGITWTPVPDTTVRAAAFRAMKRTLITDQTLEPTQVAGFNQFFDEPNGTDSSHYGAAIDQKFSKSVYGGAEYLMRDMKVPWQDVGAAELRTADWYERLGRVYLYWAPQHWLAFNAEYAYEKLDRAVELAQGAKEVETNKVPLGINIYIPFGLSVMVKETYIVQKGDFERLSAIGQFEPGSDHFWLCDAAVSYRLPSRYGFVTVGAKNLFDKSFQFFDSDPNNPSIQPKRFIYARATLAF